MATEQGNRTEKNGIPFPGQNSGKRERNGTHPFRGVRLFGCSWKENQEKTYPPHRRVFLWGGGGSRVWAIGLDTDRLEPRSIICSSGTVNKGGTRAGKTLVAAGGRAWEGVSYIRLHWLVLPTRTTKYRQNLRIALIRLHGGYMIFRQQKARSFEPG